MNSCQTMKENSDNNLQGYERFYGHFDGETVVEFGRIDCNVFAEVNIFIKGQVMFMFCEKMLL